MEAAQPWFATLLDAYAFLDASLTVEVAHRTQKPACFSGCDACCRQPIPLSLAEAIGLRLFLRTTGISASEPDSPKNTDCPLLCSGKCLAYAVRPFACRRFIAFGSPCAPGEDPTRTRPGDMLTPSQHTLLQALRMTLPVYRGLGLAPEADPPPREFFTRHTFLIQSIRTHFINRPLADL